MRFTLFTRDPLSWLPWLFGLLFAVAVDGLAARLGLQGEGRWLVRAVVAATLVLFLASHRAWVHDRSALEWIGFAAAAPAALVAGSFLPFFLRPLPALLLGGALPVYTAWRFAPDCGQTGTLWALRPGLQRALLPLAVLAFAAAFLPGCRRADPTGAAAAPAEVTHAVHPLRGEIVGVTPARGTLLVHHEPIPGYMPEMTMEFTLGARPLSDFREGQRISAQLRDAGGGEFALDHIQILDAVAASAVAAAARTLREDTLIRGKGAYRELGETAPSFTLYNQDGAVVSFDRFRGQRVVLNFIFTRCPVPTMCPAATAKMIQLQRLARERGLADLQLVSISLDPAYDTPPVLQAYAEARGIDTSNFSFLSGPEPAVRDLLRQFGVFALPSENLWKHTLATVLIDRDGKLIHRTDNEAWTAAEFLARL